MLPTKRKATAKKETDLNYSCSQPVSRVSNVVDLTEGTYDDFDLVYSSRKQNISSRPKRKAAYKPISKPKWKIPTPGKQVRHSAKIEIHSSIPLWEKYQPKNEEEIAVSKKKLSQVRSWVDSALDPGTTHSNRMLVLTGPPGTGKTAVVKLLSEEINFEIIEWINPIWTSRGSFDPEEPSRAIDTFEEFLIRSNKYPTLSLQEETSTPHCDDSRKKIVVIEDIPLLSSATNKQHFHRALEKYILSPRYHYPLILIISDTFVRNDTDSYNGRFNQDFTSVCTIIPPSILKSPFVQRISFNLIAPTFLKKALKRILDLEYSQSSHQLDTNEVDAIVAQSNGDIRNALNGLQFICLGDQMPRSIGITIKDSKGKTKFDKTKDPNSVPLFSKESNLNLFHAVGKVLYNKRIDRTAGSGSNKKSIAREWELPSHLKHHSRCNLESNPDIVLDQVPVDPDVFTSFLHQNYLGFYNDIDECVNASEYMSSSDYLMGGSNWGSSPTLSKYAAVITTRGLMFSSTAAPRYKPLYKPEIWSVNRCTREFQENLSELQTALQQSRNTANTNNEAAIKLEIGPYLSQILQKCSSTHPIINIFSRGSLGFLYQMSIFTKSSQSTYTEGSRLEDDPFSMDVIEELKEKFIKESTRVAPLGPPPAPKIKGLNVGKEYGPLADDDIEEFD
ncbi:RFC checkpoint protein Rad17 [Basidiobolus ranarum]|uniref:RFC checkpoint protein Rad17 n=1 Tax=Basidiobolus ranarum TaxID=34480 RepID=A0ABR2W503_9FUNG